MTTFKKISISLCILSVFIFIANPLPARADFGDQVRSLWNGITSWIGDNEEGIQNFLDESERLTETGVGVLEVSAFASANRAGLSTTEEGRNLAFRIGQLINYGFGLLGVVFLTMSLAGGFIWMTAGGNDEKVGKGKLFIVRGIEGMVVIFLSYALVYVIISALNAGVQ